MSLVSIQNSQTQLDQSPVLPLQILKKVWIYHLRQATNDASVYTDEPDPAGQEFRPASTTY